mgnify:CR=1 FL=1
MYIYLATKQLRCRAYDIEFVWPRNCLGMQRMLGYNWEG